MDTPPVNKLLQLLREKPSEISTPQHAHSAPSAHQRSSQLATQQDTQPPAKSDTQPATESDIQSDQSDTQSATESDIQSDPIEDTQPATESDIQSDQSDTQSATESDILRTTKSDILYVTEKITPLERVHLSKGQRRALTFLVSVRNTHAPNRTVPVGYDTISKACFLSRSGSRKVIRELCSKGLIQRLETKRGEIQGSVYLLKSNTLSVTKSDRPGPEISDTQPVTKSNTSSSSKRELLLQNILFEKMFQDLDPRSLMPFLDQFGAPEDLQDFLDKANACIMASKEGRGKAIQSPHGFLFAQLRSGYINPPEGYKTRKVQAQEIKNRQLEEELETLRRLKEEERELRFEIFKAKLAEENRLQLEREAREQVNPAIGLSTERQIAVHKDSVLRQWFEQQEEF